MGGLVDAREVVRAWIAVIRTISLSPPAAAGMRKLLPRTSVRFPHRNVSLPDPLPRSSSNSNTDPRSGALRAR